MTKDDKKLYKKLLKREKRNIKKIINKQKMQAVQEGEEFTKEDEAKIRRREREKVVASIVKRKLPEEYENKNVEFNERGKIIPNSRNEAKLIAQIRQDLNKINQRTLAGRIATILLALGISVGGISVAGRLNEPDQPENETEKQADPKDENTVEEESKEEQIYDELGNLSKEDAKIAFKEMYKELYEQSNDDELDISKLKITTSYQSYINIVTLEDGSEVVVLHGDYPEGTEKALQELGVSYRKQSDNSICYTIRYDDNVIDGTIKNYQIVSLENLTAYVNGEIESIPSVASEIPKDVKAIIVDYMSGNEVNDKDRETVTEWIISMGLEDILLGEDEKETTVASSSRDSFIMNLRDENGNEYTVSTPSTSTPNVNTNENETSIEENKNDDGR